MFARTTLEPLRRPEESPRYAVCPDCRDAIRLDRGAFKPHNWGMRLCPSSWQLPPRQSVPAA
jgi:hypothetical protein